MGRLTTRLSEGLLRKNSPPVCLFKGSLGSTTHHWLKPCWVMTTHLCEGSLRDDSITLCLKAVRGTTHHPVCLKARWGMIHYLSLKDCWGTTHHSSVWRFDVEWFTTCLSEGLLKDNSPLVSLKVWCRMIHHLSVWRLVKGQLTTRLSEGLMEWFTTCLSEGSLSIIAIGQNNKFYFLQNTWKCSVLWAYTFNICKKC